MKSLCKMYHRLAVALLAGAVVAGMWSPMASAQQTVTVEANTPSLGNCIPFGGWTNENYMGFVYKNVPAVDLRVGDEIRFDLGTVNEQDIVLDIALAATTTNGGDQPTLSGFTTIASAQTGSSRGDTIQGNYELAFTVEQPFSFGGGGLIIRFLPRGTFVADNDCDQNLYHGTAGDSSNHFVKRFFRDLDGIYPWTDGDTGSIGNFQFGLLAPVADDRSVTTNEDSSTLVLLSGQDSGGQSLSNFQVTQFPTNGTLGGVDATTGEVVSNPVTYTPDANYNGSDSFLYVADDGTEISGEAVVSITIVAVNDVPVAADDTAATDEDTAINVDVLANDTDIDADSLGVTISSSPTSGQASVGADGSIDYTPDANFNGSDSLIYQIDDGNGGTDTATLSITVAAINDAPVAGDDTATTDEDATATIDVLANDDDVDGDALTVGILTGPANGQVSVGAGGTLDYTPNANYNGSDSITYEVADGNGGTDSATVSITVDAVNDAPVFIAPTPADQAALSGAEGVEFTLDLEGEDVDGDTLTYAMTGGPAAATLDTATGDLSWTPSWEDAGTYNLSFEVSDGQTQDTRQATLTVSFVDADGDGLADTWETGAGLDPSTDDSDGDTISDGDELGDDQDNPLDSDADGTIDALDEDSDDDGLSDAVEAGDDDVSTPPADTDQDGTPDFRDEDSDDDTVGDDLDNCPLVENTDQTDTDADTRGDACDEDSDEDGLSDIYEEDHGLDPLLVDSDGDSIADGEEVGDDLDNPLDSDADGTLDALDEDSDDDGLLDVDEAGDDDVSTPAIDTDQDATPDYRDADSDDDTVGDDLDNCVLVENADQTDTDADGRGDACQDDNDGDGVLDEADNCPLVANADQLDTDEDGDGDACDADDDDDEVDDDVDNCPVVENADQVDTDDDEIGDACDPDDDNDEAVDDEDNCPLIANADQIDEDQDGVGAACDEDDAAASGATGNSASPDDGCGCSSSNSGRPGVPLALVLVGGWWLIGRRRRA